jgi:hypothetical protein
VTTGHAYVHGAHLLPTLDRTWVATSIMQSCLCARELNKHSPLSHVLEHKRTIHIRARKIHGSTRQVDPDTPRPPAHSSPDVLDCRCHPTSTRACLSYCTCCRLGESVQRGWQCHAPHRAAFCVSSRRKHAHSTVLSHGLCERAWCVHRLLQGGCTRPLCTCAIRPPAF